jgi:hypothetical protein
VQSPRAMASVDQPSKSHCMLHTGWFKTLLQCRGVAGLATPQSSQGEESGTVRDVGVDVGVISIIKVAL